MLTGGTRDILDTADLFFPVAAYTVLSAVMSVSSHLAVQRNAFSTAVAAPKVCDGSTSSSIAERLSFATVYTSAKGRQLFLLYPNIGNHVYSYQWQTTTLAPGAASVVESGNDGTVAQTVHSLASIVEASAAETKRY